MKILSLSVIFIFSLLLQCRLEAASQDVARQLKLQVEVEAEDSNVTAAKYCAFLNATAAADPHEFYNEKMGGQATAPEITTACLLRFGAPGSYYYEVAQEKEDCSVSFISQENAARYWDWENNEEDAISWGSHCKEAQDALLAASTFNVNCRVAGYVAVSGEPASKVAPWKVAQGLGAVALLLGDSTRDHSILTEEETAWRESEGNQQNVTNVRTALPEEEHLAGGHWLKQYMERALESMRQDTVSNRTRIVQRAFAKAREAGASERALKKLPLFLDQSTEFRIWLKIKGPRLRAIPPSLVEEEIKNPGTTAIEVVRSQLGAVITAYRKDDIFDRESECNRKENERGFYLFDKSHPAELEEGKDGKMYLVPRGRTIYHDISYTEHALERMALDTPSNRRRVEDRFIEKARTPKEEERKLSEEELKALQIFFEQPAAFQDWWKENDPLLEERYVFSMEEEGEENENNIFDLGELSAYLLRVKKKVAFLGKVREADQNNTPEVAELWKKSVLQWQVALENLREALEARTSGTEKEFTNFYQMAKAASLAASWLEEAATSLEQAKEAEQSGNASLAGLWKNCAEQYQQLLAEYEKKTAAVSLEQYSSGMNPYSGINVRAELRTCSLEKVTKTLRESLQATKEGDFSCSSRLEKVAEHYHIVVEYQKKLDQADLLGNKEKKNYFAQVKAFALKSADLLNKALSIEKESQYLKDQISYLEERFQSLQKMLSEEVSKLTQKQSSKQKRHVESTQKELRAKQGKLQEKLRKKLLEFRKKQLLGEDYQKATQACISKNKEEYNLWKKAAEAEERDNSSLALLWRQVAEEYQVIVDCKKQGMEARASGDEVKNHRIKQQFVLAQKMARQGEKEATMLEALEKATTAEKGGRLLLANFWRQSVDQDKIADNYLAQAVEARTAGIRGIHWYKAARSARQNASWLKEAAIFFEKAEVAKSTNYLSGKFFQKVAEQYKKNADDQQRATEVYASGDKEKWERWDESMEFLAKNARQLALAATSFEEYSEAIGDRNQEEVELWHQSSEQRYAAAGQYRKAASAHLNNHSDLALLCEKAADQNKTAALCYEEAIETRSRAKREAFHQAADRAKASADDCKNAAALFEKALQAEMSNNQALALPLRKSSEQYEAAGRCSDRAAQMAVIKYTCLKQPLEAAFWESKGAYYLRAAEFHQKSAQAYAQGRASEGELLRQEASAAEESINELQKPIKKTKKKEG